MKRFLLIVAGLLISVGGLQAGQSVQAASLDNGSFMSLWRSYSHCQTTTDYDQMRETALTLTAAANGSRTKDEGFVLPLPGNLEKFVSAPAARFAVDIKAMAAACSLRAGSAAVEAGKPDVAKDLLHTVLSYQPESDYAYYALQAKALLSELEPTVMEVTLNRP